MFGISFSELFLIGAVALMVVGPSKLPKMLSTLGKWAGKLRRITNEVRHQTGIDELLREEGLKGGLNELRGLVRGDLRAVGSLATRSVARPTPATSAIAQSNPRDPYANVPHDRSREYPVEGCDAYRCLPEDLFQNRQSEEVAPPPDAAAKAGTEPTAAAPEATTASPESNTAAESSTAAEPSTVAQPSTNAPEAASSQRGSSGTSIEKTTPAAS